MVLTALMFVFSALLVLLDQWSKHLAVKYLSGQPPVVLWPDVFELYFLEQGNDGVAWGLFSGQMWLIIPLTLLVMLILAVMLVRSDLRHSKLFSFSLALILGGGVGNLVDRIAYGAVVDFFHFTLIEFPIFNVADCCVCVGAALLFVYLLFVCKDSDIINARGLIIGSKPLGKETRNDGTDTMLDGDAGAGE